MLIRRIELAPVIKRGRREAERATKAITKQANKARKSFKKTFSKKRNQRRTLYAGAVLLIVALSGVLYTSVSAMQDKQKSLETTKQLLDKRHEQLQSTKDELKEVETEKVQTQQQLDEKAAKEQELQKQVEDLNAQLQAKIERQRVTAVYASYVAPTPARTSVAVSGDCGAWLAAAGVTDTQSAMTLIGRESGCNPSVVNKSSGSCGVAQELPCGKSGCSLGDGYCQVAWMNQYVLGRYGSWAAALNHSYTMNWY